MTPETGRPGDELPAVLAVDVGNSKTDVALIAADGTVLGAVRGPTSSHQQVGVESGFARLVSVAEQAISQAGRDPRARPAARLVAYCAAGVDFPSDERLLTKALRETGLGAAELVVNDCYGGLRAGTSRTWGVCVISGSGINCLGVSPDGHLARFDALGEISGDWGGGGGVGMAALAAAVRSEDGRGPDTLLARTVPEFFGLTRPRQVTVAMYREKIPTSDAIQLAPLVFSAAEQGDAVSRSIVDHLADEVVAFATAAIRRLRLQRADTHVVLAGGMFRADDPVFYDRIERGITAVAAAAVVRRMTAPPVVGAALLGFDRLGAAPAAPEVEQRLRGQLTLERIAGG
jgi:N-acetylglucosamine kinase-like BadF-type ATPase